MRWLPEEGHVPRGWLGATGHVSDIELVLITAEPGDPADTERFEDTQPDRILDTYDQLARSWLRDNSIRRSKYNPPFHRNLLSIMNLCWPGVSLEEQLQKTWVTPSVLCSAKKSASPISTAISKHCANQYLAPQLDLMSSAFVITLGAKAKKRLEQIGRFPNAEAQHPSARPYTNPRASWEAAAEQFIRYKRSHSSKSQ